VTEDNSRQLMLGPFPVSKRDRGGSPKPGWSLVFSLSDGVAKVVTCQPSRRESRSYHYRYEVDITDKELRWQQLLPSDAPGFSFRASLVLTWRITSPAEIVRRGIADMRRCESIIRRKLEIMLTSQSRKYDIEEHARAEAALNSALGQGDLILPEGVTISAFTARLELDTDTEKHAKVRRGMDRAAVIAKHKQKGEVDSVMHDGRIKAIVGDQELEIQQKRAEALRAAARGDGGLLVQVVAQDPSQLRGVLQDVAAHHEIAMATKLKIFNEMVNNKLIQPADAEPIWQSFFQSSPSVFGAALWPGAAPSERALSAGAEAGQRAEGSHVSQTPPRAEETLAGEVISAESEDDPGDGDQLRGQDAAGVTGWRPVGGRSRSTRSTASDE
jgi:hypothetical protein